MQSRKEKDIGEILENVQPHDILKYGLIPELVGRLPVVTPLRSLTREDMIRILTEPKNSLTKQYEALLAMDHVELSFTREALEAIADKTMAMDLGARGLRSIMENLMRDIMFRIPSDPSITGVEITAACVRGEAQPRLIHAAKEIAG